MSDLGWSRRVYLRPFKLHTGGEDYVRLPACGCKGIALKISGGWTLGRRGPIGGVCGVCGACGGAIVDPTETGILIR